MTDHARRPLLVTEIVRRLDQGMTRPFLVRAEDNALYVAKGRETTQRGLIAEWLCAHLAQALALPVPDFSLLDVPPELAEAFGAEGRALGSGMVFGSRQEIDVQEFATTQLKHIPVKTRQQVFAFDWWVENADRSLTEHGGNPNLLWQAAPKRLLVIDHNLAFDPTFDETDFLTTHAFRGEADTLFGDLVCQAEMSASLAAVLEAFDTASATIPPAWFWQDVEQTLPIQVDLKVIRSRLQLRAGLARGIQP